MSYELMVAEAIIKDRERELKALMRHPRHERDRGTARQTVTQRLAAAFRSVLARRGVQRPATV